MILKYKAKRNCKMCNGTGYFTTAMDFTQRCDCYKETTKYKKRKKRIIMTQLKDILSEKQEEFIWERCQADDKALEEILSLPIDVEFIDERGIQTEVDIVLATDNYIQNVSINRIRRELAKAIASRYVYKKGDLYAK